MDAPLALVPGLASLAFVTSITPGPNNLMLMQSGLRFGLRRSLPHLAGVVGGFAILLGVADLGLGALVQQYPHTADLAAVACAAYLFWMAATLVAEPGFDTGSEAAAGRPMHSWEAALFQWVNPKAWSMAIAAAALMARADTAPALRAGWLIAITVAVNLPCVLAWTALGAQLRERLQDPLTRGLFTAMMVVLLVATALSMFLPLRVELPREALLAIEPALAIGR